MTGTLLLEYYEIDHAQFEAEVLLLARPRSRCVCGGNRSRIAARYDVSRNKAWAVSGRRLIALFSPDQIGNLYIGRLEFTMAQQPASLVDFAVPDFQAYPKVAEALKAAHVVVLESCDALYMPAQWWHHVEAEGPLNLLVNYWRHGGRGGGDRDLKV